MKACYPPSPTHLQRDVLAQVRFSSSAWGRLCRRAAAQAARGPQGTMGAMGPLSSRGSMGIYSGRRVGEWLTMDHFES